MNDSLDYSTTGLLLLVGRLQQTNQALGRQTILPFAELKLPRVARDYDAAIRNLLEQELIAGNADSFSLTPAGIDLLHSVSQQHSLPAWFYNEYFETVRHSRAHALFCERVYGKNLSQHGLADMGQIHALLSALDVKPGMALLDFGCGDGQISEYVSDTTETLVSGVDIADQALEIALARTQAKRSRLNFYCADVERNRGVFPSGKFDRIFAIDSIFFAQDERAVTQVLLNHLAPAGKVGVFYHCPPHIGARETPFAKAADSLGIPYRVDDFSEQNTEHWVKKKQVLLELQPLFKAEANDFLFKNRMAECNGGMEHFHRYLYLVTP